MALISTNNVADSQGQVTQFEFEVPTNQSVMVKDIHVESASGAYVQVFIDSSIVGYFRSDSGTLGNHLPFLSKGVQYSTILGFLGKKNIFKGYPLGKGQKMIIYSTSLSRIAIDYDKYDEGDIKSDMENGSNSSILTYLAYGRPSAAVGSSGDTIIDTRVNPGEFSRFPYIDTVPATKEITVQGVCFSSRAADDGTTKTNYIHTKYLKMKKGRTTLFSDDRLGILAQGKDVSTGGTFEAENGFDTIGEGTNLYSKTPLLFGKPLTFSDGEKLDTYVTTEVAATAGTFQPKELEVAYIITEKEKR